MKHIHLPGDDAIMWNRYAAYIDPLKHLFPTHLRDLVSNPCFYDLSSEETLHDAKLIELRIMEISGDEGTNAPSSVSIQLDLRGVWRNTRLLYKNVRRYSITGRNGSNSFSSFHSDLFTHEFSLEPDGCFMHELQFVTASAFEIVFEDLEITQQAYDDPAQ